MAEIRLPLNPRVAESHALHGAFAISNEHGFVLIGYYAGAGENDKHAAEVHLDGDKRFDIEAMPGTDNAGWPRYFDQALDLGIERIAVTMLDSGEFANGASVEAGDLFLWEGATYLIGKPANAQHGNAIDLESKRMKRISHGDGYRVRKWRIDGYAKDDSKVFTITSD